MKKGRNVGRNTLAEGATETQKPWEAMKKEQGVRKTGD